MTAGLRNYPPKFMGFIVTFIVCQSSANWWGYSVSHQVIKDLVSYVFQDFLLFSSQVVDE
jgi:hypothetical protein